MTYTTANPPALITQSIGGVAGTRTWIYVSTDAIATVNSTNYFTNGAALGMKVGDNVIVRDSTTPTTSLCVVIDVTAGGQADLSDGTAVSQVDGD